MFYQLMMALTPEEQEAMGVAAVAALPDMVNVSHMPRTAPVTLSTGETIEAPLDTLHFTKAQMRKPYQDSRLTDYLMMTCKLAKPSPDKTRQGREDAVRQPAHGLLSLSRVSNSRFKLFDHMGDTMHPMTLRVHRARDYDDKDRLDPRMMRMEEEQLVEIMLSSAQYARLIRCDESLTPCTITDHHRLSYLLERNPHFDEQFDSRDIQQEAKDLLADDIAKANALRDLMGNGLSRKPEREAAEAQLVALLEALDGAFNKLHDLADSARGQAGDAAKTRHNNLLAREVAALPSGMREQLKQLADDNHPVAKLLTAQTHND